MRGTTSQDQELHIFIRFAYAECPWMSCVDFKCTQFCFSRRVRDRNTDFINAEQRQSQRAHFLHLSFAVHRAQSASDSVCCALYTSWINEAAEMCLSNVYKMLLKMVDVLFFCMQRAPSLGPRRVQCSYWHLKLLLNPVTLCKINVDYYWTP